MATQKERMLAGEPYFAADAQLTAERLRARQVLHDFNGARPGKDAPYPRALASLFGAFGEGTVVMAPFQCDYGYNIRIGRNCFVNYNCVFLDCAPITIGDDAQIAPGVQLLTATHPIAADARRAGEESALPITLGDGVWIGGGAILLPGVTVGDDTVVGAGSVVTRDLPANVVAAGNPCRVLRAIDEPRRG
jgi:maltose O-acetyltransferase